MANEEIRVGLAVISDAGTRKTVQDLADVKKKIAELKTEFKSGAKDADTFAKEFADLEKQAKKLDKALDEVGEQRRINLDSGQLEDASKKGGAEGLRQIGRDIRNLPSVQVPGLGIGTDTFGRAAEVAGRLGISIGQLGVAGAIAAPFVIALGVAVNKLQEDIQKSIEAINAGAKTVSNVNEFLSKATTDEAQARIEDLKREQEVQRKNIEDFREAQRKLVEQSGTSEAIQQANPKYQEFNKLIEESGNETARLDLEIRKMTEGIDEGATAANDAAEAEKKLAAERTKGVLQEAQQAGDLAVLKERAADLTQEQIDSELEALERRRVGIEAELESLRASGDTSEAVAAKIKDLEGSLKFLGQQSDVLNSARKTAQTDAQKKAEKDAEKEKEKAEKEAQKRLEQTAKAQQNYNDKLADAGTRFRDTLADIGVGLKDNFADNTRKLQDDLNKSAIEFNQDQLKEERAFQRDLAQIQRDSARAEQDAVQQRDFAALARARQAGQDALDQRQTEETTTNQEQLQEFIQQRQALATERDLANRDDLIAAQRAERDAKVQRDRAYRDAATDRDRALRDINTMEQTYQRNSLNNWQNYFDQLTGMQGRAMSGGAGSGGSGNSSSRRQGLGSSSNTMSFDDFLTTMG